MRVRKLNFHVTPAGGRSLKINLPEIGAPSKSIWRTVMACARVPSARKKGPGGPQQKSSRQARTLRPHGTKICIFMWRRLLVRCSSKLPAPRSRDSRKFLRVRRFSPVVRKTRTVILNSLGDSGRDSGNTKQAWRSARRKTIYRRFQASLCENPCSVQQFSFSWISCALRLQVTLPPILQSINETKVHCDFLNRAEVMECYWNLIK